MDFSRPDEQGHDHVRKNHDVAKRKDWEQLLAAGLFFGLFLFVISTTYRRALKLFSKPANALHASFHFRATLPAPFVATVACS